MCFSPYVEDGRAFKVTVNKHKRNSTCLWEWGFVLYWHRIMKDQPPSHMFNNITSEIFCSSQALICVASISLKDKDDLYILSLINTLRERETIKNTISDRWTRLIEPWCAYIQYIWQPLIPLSSIGPYDGPIASWVIMGGGQKKRYDKEDSPNPDSAEET